MKRTFAEIDNSISYEYENKNFKKLKRFNQTLNFNKLNDLQPFYENRLLFLKNNVEFSLESYIRIKTLNIFTEEEILQELNWKVETKLNDIYGLIEELERMKDYGIDIDRFKDVIDYYYNFDEVKKIIDINSLNVY